MFDYAGVAVEMWHQILLAVIDVPYILDTLVQSETDHWRHAARYQDREVYEESERQRRALRLVCHDWRAFADAHHHRWIDYDGRETANVVEKAEAEAAIHSVAINSIALEWLEGAILENRPRRISLHLTLDKDMDLFRMTIDHCSSMVTVLGIHCVKGYEDQIFEHILEKSFNIPMVRCLSLPAPKLHPNPLLAISVAFPKLHRFGMVNQDPHGLKDGDNIVLPRLEVLGLDVSALPATTLKKWHLPSILHLETSLGVMPSHSFHMILEPIMSLGASLTFLQLDKAYRPLCLPRQFWIWCPCLLEFLSSFSWVYFETPAPPRHPLRYVVHSPHQDHLKNPLLTPSSTIQNPAVLHSIQCLPPQVELFVVWGSWSAYQRLLATSGDAGRLPSKSTGVLRKMQEYCRLRYIRVEDQNRVELRDFLASIGDKSIHSAMVDWSGYDS